MFTRYRCWDLLCFYSSQLNEKGPLSRITVQPLPTCWTDILNLYEDKCIWVKPCRRWYVIWVMIGARATEGRGDWWWEVWAPAPLHTRVWRRLYMQCQRQSKAVCLKERSCGYRSQRGRIKPKQTIWNLSFKKREVFECHRHRAGFEGCSKWQKSSLQLCVLQVTDWVMETGKSRNLGGHPH